MCLRLSKSAFTRSQGYVCLSCRLRSASCGTYNSVRYQHAVNPPLGDSSVEASIESPNSSSAISATTSAALPHSQSGEFVEQDETSVSSTQDRNRASSPKDVSVSPQATELQQVLQRQYAERRRQNMAKLGQRQAPAKRSTKKRDGAGTKAAKLQDKQKTIRRLESKKSKSTKPALSSSGATSHRSVDAVSTNKGALSSSLQGYLAYHRIPENERFDLSSTDPFVKLQADVQKLKKALEADDKVKCTTKSQLSKLQASKGQADTLRKKETSKPSLAKQSARKNAPKVAENTPSPSEGAPLRPNSLTTKLPGNLGKGTKSLQGELVKNVSLSMGRVKITKKPQDRPLEAARRRTRGETVAIEVVNAETLDVSAVDVDQPPVPNLSYGLERVLFNPGVYHLQDPRSRVYNFDPYLQKIMPVSEFDFSALKAYVTSSNDEALKQIAQQYGKRYVGSSSSMTGILAHFHFLLSQWRELGTKMLSNEFPKTASRSFTVIQKAPTAVFLRWRDGSYAIDADKQFANANVLMMLGKSMEKLLTLKKDQFEKYRRSSEAQVSSEERNAPESYHYSTMGDFLMRSQLDAYDARLPGTGMFDLKTRAVVSVRMDALRVEKGMGYEIKTRQGAWESYEREYYDMIRSAMLKYSLQVRMGRMDGIFVAYHNTQRIFGFQYISLAEMDAALHGQWDTTLGDQQFKVSLNLLNKVLDRATKKYPEQSLRIHFETRDAETPFMYIFAEPVTEGQIQEIQSENDAEIAEYERKMLGLHEGTKTGHRRDDDGKWADMQADVEEEMDKDEVSITTEEIDDTGLAEGETPACDGLESGNRGPLWGSSHAGRVQDEPGGAAACEEDSEEEDESSLEGIGGNHNDGSIEDGQDPEETLAEPMGQDEGADDDSADAETAGRDSLDQDSQECEEEMSRINSDTEKGGTDPAIVAEQIAANGITSEADVPFLDSAAKAVPTVTDSEEVFSMTLTIRNKVNDRYVLRPENLSASDRWAVEYALAEVGDKGKAWSLYQASQSRRRKALNNDDGGENQSLDWYMQNLRGLSENGEKWRQQQDELDKNRPTVVLGHSSASGQLDEVQDAESEP